MVLVRDAFAQVEVATFRSDHEYEDGRRPNAVHFETDPKADVVRRDFTINGLMMDPETGQALDYVGGRADLDAGWSAPSAIPTPASARTSAAAPRHALRRPLGFAIEPATFDAIADAALIIRVSPSACAINWSKFSPRAAPLAWICSIRAACSPCCFPKWPPCTASRSRPFTPKATSGRTRACCSINSTAPRRLSPSARCCTTWQAARVSRGDRIRFDGHVEKGVEMARAILNRLRCSRDDTDQVESLVAITCTSKTSAA